MSFDLGNLVAAAEFGNSFVTSGNLSGAGFGNIYQIRLTNLQQDIINFFRRTEGVNKCFKLNQTFLSVGDKAELVSKVEAKGYTCTEEGKYMFITCD